MSVNKNTTLGVIIGNRDFFPDKLVGEARTEILSLFKKLNITSVLLSDADSNESIEVLKKLNSDKKNYLPQPDLIKITEGYFGWKKAIQG